MALLCTPKGVPLPVQKDPWDWMVEEVVFAITDPESTLLKSDPRLMMPGSEELASLLREDGTDGLALLCDIDKTELENNLGVKHRGHRNRIIKLIQLLQKSSVKYQQDIVASRRSPDIGTISRLVTPSTASPQHHETAFNPQYPEHRLSPVAQNGLIQTFTSIDSIIKPSLLHQESSRCDIPEAAKTSASPASNGEGSRPSGGVIEGLGIRNSDTVGGQIDFLKMHGHQETGGVFSDEILDNFESTAQTEHYTRPGESIVIDQEGRKRRRLVLSSAGNSSNTEPVKAQSITEETPFSSSVNPLQNGSEVSGQLSIEHPLDLRGSTSPAGEPLDETCNADIPMKADISVVPNASTQQKQAEPGALVVDVDGRKRMRPILLTEPGLDIKHTRLDDSGAGSNLYGTTLSALPANNVDATLPTRQPTYGRKANRRKDQIYLGPEPLPVDELFYSSNSFEASLDTEDSANQPGKIDNFSFVLDERSSSGRCAYVNSRMKYFLQSQNIQLNQGGNQVSGKIPYPDRLGRKNYPLSMTVFSQSSEGVSALRSNRSKWLEGLSVRAPMASGQQTGNVFNVADPSLAQDDNDDPEWKALEKWNHMEGNDNVLPLYGESDSEGEYDLDTWRDMELERGELERPIGKSRRPKLATEDVCEAIAAAITQLIKEWELKRKPKLQLKAWRLWAKSRREKNANQQIRHFDTEIDRLNARLNNLRKEITVEEWSKTGQILKQCKILQPTVFESEDNKWRIHILNMRRMPEKPPPIERKMNITKTITPLSKDDEDLATDADSSQASDGSLDDFIVDDYLDVDDEQPALLDDEVTMADVEDDIQSVTLVDDRDPSQPESPVIAPKVEPRARSAKSPNTKSFSGQAVIDLTQDSDPVEPEIKADQPERFHGIKTPPIHSSENESDAFQRSRSKKPVFRVFPVPDTASVIDLGTDSAASTDIEAVPVKKTHPTFRDVPSIRKMNPSELIEQADRKRLLVWIIAHAPKSRVDGVLNYLSSVSEEISFSHVTLGLQSMRDYKQSVRGLERPMSDAILSIASWLVCWTIPIKADVSSLGTAHIADTLKAIEEEDCYGTFYDFLSDCLSYYETVPIALAHSTPETKRQKVIQENSDEDLQITLKSKRKYVVPESQEGLDKRKAAQNRMRGDEERRRREELRSRFTARSPDNAGASKVIVNPGKLEDQDFIYLDPEFGNGMHVKPHQQEGLQFLWREITAEPKDPQGCLLAQTMGLGKTMQVIALIVTISGVGNSPNTNIRRHVPRALRKPRTLVLCPPALLENWWDEFLIWMPRQESKSVGGLRKVSVSMKPFERLEVIQDWNNKGGVLIIGYDTFKNLIHNPSRMSKKKTALKLALNEDQHGKVKEALLVRPTLVVADEAHSFKTKSSKLNSAINQIQTRSRVALTGSPLSNNLEEYYTLVDWIAPDYLGKYPEFKAKYEEPIREGLYQDSTESQYRQSRMRLKALELEMEPKVHRANISVLQDDLKGKLEFVIKVPLTALQEQLYELCVESMRSEAISQEPGKASLWSWLGALQLLCNHPKCFQQQMQNTNTNPNGDSESRTATRNKSTNKTAIDEGSAGSDEDPTLLIEPKASETFAHIIEESEKIYNSLLEPIDALGLSNKMQILMKILEFANAAQDKVLVFSHRITTLDYIQTQLKSTHQKFARIDGTIAAQKRQQISKNFNKGTVNICLISTRAGGTGLNMYGANRVVILDEHFNPTWERQAIGRAYRIGQQKHVYVYRLTAGGTFEQEIQNQALFKEQLATRVVDKKNPNRSALKGAGQYLFPLKALVTEDLSKFHGRDSFVLDRLLAEPAQSKIVSITPSETFHIEDGVELTPAERQEAEQIQKAEQLRRRDPQAYQQMEINRRARQLQPNKQYPASHVPVSTQPVPSNLSHDPHPAMEMPSSTALAPATSMGGLPSIDSSNLGYPNDPPIPQWADEMLTSLQTEPVPPSTVPDIFDGLKFAGTKHSASTPSGRGNHENSDKEQVYVESQGPDHSIMRKHSLGAEETSEAKRTKLTPSVKPNFKGNDDIERGLTDLLTNERARSRLVETFQNFRARTKSGS